MNELNNFQQNEHTAQESLLPVEEQRNLRSASTLNIVLEFHVETIRLKLSCN